MIWSDVVKVTPAMRGAYENTEILARSALSDALGGLNAQSAVRADQPVADLQKRFGEAKVTNARAALDGMFAALTPAMQAGVHAATSAAALRAMIAFVGAQTALPTFDGTGKAPPRSMAQVLEAHAVAYLSADAKDPESIKRLLADYDENALVVATTLSDQGELPEASKYTQFRTGAAIGEGLRSELAITRPREEKPIVDAVSVVGSLATIEWHKNTPTTIIHGRDVFYAPAGKIVFQSSYLRTTTR